MIAAVRRGLRRIGASVVLAGAVVSPALHASESPQQQLELVEQRIDAEHIYRDRAWLTLVAYQAILSGGWKSQADRLDFFLSPQGKRDPRTELIATVRALFFDESEKAEDDDAARCRFPARFTWLQARLGLQPGADPLQQCAALRAWFEPLAADSMSIDFASSYLENPSSSFGHTFLRFQHAGTPRLLTPTINYAADSSREGSKLGFIAKGLLGGFPGIAEQLPYFRRIRIYGDNEGRDVWEYPLRLDPRQIRLLLFNLWEVQDGVFDYYFLDENCSYRTLALIAAARPDQDLLHPLGLDVVPVETVKVLRDHGLIDEPVYWPSSVKTVYWHTRDFSTAETKLVVAIARGERAPTDLASLTLEDRARVLRAAAEYLSILINRGQLELETRAELTQALVQERLRLDHPVPPDPVEVPTRPDYAHGGRTLSVGWIDRRGVEGIELGYAGFQHELTDPLAGYAAGAEVIVLRGRYAFSDGGAHELETLDLLHVESKTPSTRLFQQAAWSLQLGAERKYIDNGRPLVSDLAYASGRAYETGIGVLALTLGASLDAASALRAGTALEAELKLDLTRQTSWLSYQLFFEQARYLLGDDSHRHQYGMRLGLPLASDLGLALELQRGGARVAESQSRLELRKFF